MNKEQVMNLVGYIKIDENEDMLSKIDMEEWFLLALPIMYCNLNVRKNYNWKSYFRNEEKLKNDLRAFYKVFNRLSLEEALSEYNKNEYRVFGISTQIYLLVLAWVVGYVSYEDVYEKTKEIVMNIKISNFKLYGENFIKDAEHIFMGEKKVIRYMKRKMNLLLYKNNSPWKYKDFQEIIYNIMGES